MHAGPTSCMRASTLSPNPPRLNPAAPEAKFARTRLASPRREPPSTCTGREPWLRPGALKYHRGIKPASRKPDCTSPRAWAFPPGEPTSGLGGAVTEWTGHTVSSFRVLWSLCVCFVGSDIGVRQSLRLLVLLSVSPIIPPHDRFLQEVSPPHVVSPLFSFPRPQRPVWKPAEISAADCHTIRVGVH